MPNRQEMLSLSDRMETNHADFFNQSYTWKASQTLYQSPIFTSFVPTVYYWTSTTDAAPVRSRWRSAVAVDLPAVDGVEVQVFADDGDPRLAAAVEWLSPRNKDRPAARQAFAVKCVGYLQQGSSVVVVDTVTTRRADLNGAILSLLGVDVGAAVLPLASLSAVSYRAVGREEESQQLQAWPAPLALGQPLPTLPLWIASDFSVPLDLETSYQMTCADLRIHQAPVRLLPTAESD